MTYAKSEALWEIATNFVEILENWREICAEILDDISWNSLVCTCAKSSAARAWILVSENFLPKELGLKIARIIFESNLEEWERIVELDEGDKPIKTHQGHTKLFQKKASNLGIRKHQQLQQQRQQETLQKEQE